jgi:hypothetical protein
MRRARPPPPPLVAHRFDYVGDWGSGGRRVEVDAATAHERREGRPVRRVAVPPAAPRFRVPAASSMAGIT